MNKTDLKFLIDVGVGKQVESCLSKMGFDMKAVRDIDPRLPDEEILKIASHEKRMVITMDKDFGELVYNSGLHHSGVLLLRLDDANGDQKVNIISIIMENFADKLQNYFCTYQHGILRIRK
jgi:predicted nuclease of predicted toxin-antitoxin system